MVQILILLAALAVATTAGLLLRQRSGKVRAAPAAAAVPAQLGELVAASTGPLVLHFSAPWCRPCDAVRRVVSDVVAELSAAPHPPHDVELDIDENSTLAKELGVLSLPSTFIFDAAATTRFRISGVPKASELRAALWRLAHPVAE